jgi:hypothetical protein
VGRALIATRRDDSDVAITTSFGIANLTQFTAITEELSQEEAHGLYDMPRWEHREIPRFVATLASPKYNFPSIVGTLLNEGDYAPHWAGYFGRILTDGIEMLLLCGGLSYYSVSYMPSTTERRKTQSNSGRQSIRQQTEQSTLLAHEENNAANYSPYCFSSAAFGCTTDMALQHGVGLLSEWRTGAGPADNPCSSHREKDLSFPWYEGFDQ